MSNDLDPEALNQTLIQMSSEALLALSPNGEILSWNEGAGSLFGFRSAQAIGKRFDLLLGNGAAAPAVVALDRARADGVASFVWAAPDAAGPARGVNVTLRRVDARGQAQFIAVRGTADSGNSIGSLEESSDLRTRGLLEAAPDAMLLVDGSGKIALANHQTEKLFGYSREELIGKSIDVLVPERFRSAHPGHRNKYFGELRTRPMGAGIDLFALRKDGSEFPAEISLAPVQARDGTFVTAAVRDITERRKVEAKFRGFLEAAPDAVVIVNEAGKIMLVNSQTEKLFGYDRSRLIGHEVDVLVPQRFRARHSGHRTTYFSNSRTRAMGSGLDLHGLRADGSEFPVEISLSPLDTEDGTLVSAAIRDITERKKAEDKFRGLLESAPDAMVIVGKDGRIALVNAQTEKLFGCTRKDLLGKPIEVLVPVRFRGKHPGHRSNYFFGPKARSMGSGLELHAMRADGSEFPVEISLSPLDTEEGVLVSAAIRDVTERKRLDEVRRENQEIEERNRRAELEGQNRRIEEANRLKSEFVANMSHELRTPLNSVIGFAELMATGKVGPLADNHKEYLGDILASSKHLLQLINDVLDLAKVESGKIEIRPEPIDIPRIVSEVRDILRGIAGERRTRIDLDTVAAPDEVVLDAAKFKQVLYNYLSNAIKFTPDGGFVTVRVTPEGPAHIKVEVEDTGIGIRAEDLHRLFIEFQQLDAGTGKKYGGTGLGLAVTKRIVEAQGGSVGVRSVIGRGSTFWAVLPRVAIPVGMSEPVEVAHAE
jgi:PAS domain S-box-containing protein